MIEHDANEASSFLDAMMVINDYINKEFPSIYNPSYSIFLHDTKKYIYITLEQKSYDGRQHEQSYEIGNETNGKIVYYNIQEATKKFSSYIENIKCKKYYYLGLFSNTPQFLAYKPYIIMFLVIMYASFIIYSFWNKNIIQALLYSAFIHGLLFIPAYKIHNEENHGSFGRLFPRWTIVINWMFIIVYIGYISIDYLRL